MVRIGERIDARSSVALGRPMMSREYQRAQNHIVILGCMSARQRVASFLLLMAEQSSGDNEIELSMTRRDIADYLALTSETVSRTISQFQDDALISVATRRIVLRDGAALTKVAVNENYAASYRHAVSTETVD
jgi:CRP-like cAMP-binding protein